MGNAPPSSRRRSTGRAKWLVPALAVVAFLLASAGLASAGLVRSGNLLISLQGKISPNVLPRDRLVPIAVRVSSGIRVLNDRQPPILRRIKIELNREGKLYDRGLPTCPPRRLESTTSSEALARCRSALVGHGSVAAQVNLPGAPFPARGRLLAFNGRSRGRPVVLAHVYGVAPAPTTLVLRLYRRHRRSGTFGTVLSTRLPVIAGNWGYVSDIEMTIRRRYRHRGTPRSFLSASCPAPEGFPGAVFTLARATYYFSDGRRTTSPLTRNCRVRS